MAFLGKWYKLEKQENYDEYIESLGLPEGKKEFFLNYKPNQKFEKDGDNYTHFVYFADKERKIPFTDGVEFSTNFKDMSVKSVYTVTDNGINQVIKFTEVGDFAITIEKEFSDDQLVETIKSNQKDGEMKRYYKSE